ncbi:MAG: ATP-dependent DNA helicase [Bacteriovoracia bacterium]
MKTIQLSLQAFAQPSPRKGSIEPSSGFNTLKKGIELHQKIQEQKKAEYPEYETEVSIQAEFENDGYFFKVSGRMDGFLPGGSPRIEEIKSSFNIFDLAKNIKDKRLDHPYYLQLASYGYFYWLKHGVKPELGFELISSRRQETYSFDLYWDVKEYERWLSRRLDELVLESIKAEKRLARRKKLSENMPFPFESPRRGQVELMTFIEKGMEHGKKMLLQAPTGLGKTIGVLYPTLKESLSRGQRVIYLTPKNSQQVVAEEAIERLQAKGCQTKSLTITAKSKMCMKAEPLCNPDYCEFARDYYDKLNTFDLRNELAKKKKLSARVMKNLAQKYEVCPFELQLEAIPEAEVIICDYNYVFGHDSVLGKLSSEGFEQVGKPNLVIDEAHNLPSRTMGNFSPSVSTLFLEGLRKDIQELPKKFRSDAEELLNMCISTLEDVTPTNVKTEARRLDAEDFIFVNEELKSFLSTYLDSDVEIKSRDVVLRMVFYWGEFTEILSSIDQSLNQFFMTVQNDGKGRSVKITCCDASTLIKERYDNFRNHVLFSATLKPFDFYSKLSGLSEDALITEEFLSPFEKKNRKVMIIPQISTKYSSRQQNYPRIAETIERIMKEKEGNYLAFFPSFDFMENVLKCFNQPGSTRVMKQKRFMRNEEVEATLELMKMKTAPVILFAVQGGVFSEGIDYSGDMVIGAFVVGPPLPSFDFEREKMKEYYESEYQAGFDYAYTYPAMAKAVQAAGRVIRSESDRGIIILMDDRFLEKNYSQSLPQDWFKTSPKELVSTSILNDVKEFWTANGE